MIEEFGYTSRSKNSNNYRPSASVQNHRKHREEYRETKRI